MNSDARLGAALVALQFGLMAVIGALAGPVFVRGQAPVVAWAVGGGAVALGLWALSANRPGNFNIRPIPKPGGQLVQVGPYRWIRHPMYSSILLAAVAGLLGADADQRLAVAGSIVALAAVLWVKAGLEERWMVAHHPGYAAYRASTRRFLPGLV